MHREKNKDGFTLLQFLSALTILGILLIAGVPSLNTMLQDNKLKSIAESFYIDMQWARSEAIRNNSNVYVDLRTGSTWCYGYKKGSSCSCNVAGDCTIKTVNSTNYQPVLMSVNGIASNRIQFQGGNGSVGGQNGAVVFSIGNRTVNVEINPVGRVRICSSMVGGYQSCSN